jgi:hypothetical protein
MPGFNGVGNFIRTYNWTQDAANAIPILAARFDTEDNGFATGLSNCICRDGQSTISADIPFNNKKITGLADPVSVADALNLQTGDARYAPIAATTGSFTANLTDMASATTGTVNYRIISNQAFLWANASILGTSNAAGLTLTNLPAALRPVHAVWAACPIVDSSDVAQVSAIISAGASTIVFQNDTWSGITLFTPSGSKGLPLGWQLSYNLS